MPTCSAAGHTVAYDDRGTGPIVLLLHAFPLDRRMWRPQTDTLTDSYRLITPDLPGFGHSAAVPELTIDAMADAAGGCLTAAGATGPVVVGGCSMGGYAALAFARKYPDRVRALVLIDTKAEPDDETGRANRNKLINAAATLTPAAVIDQHIPKLLGETTRNNRPGVVDEVRTIGSAQAMPGIVDGVVALRDRPDARPGLASISVPTLVIVGAEDAVTPPDVARKLAAGISGSQLVELPGVGHLPNLEDPPAFDATVRAFLGRLP